MLLLQQLLLFQKEIKTLTTWEMFKKTCLTFAVIRNSDRKECQLRVYLVLGSQGSFA